MNNRDETIRGKLLDRLTAVASMRAASRWKWWAAR